MPRWCLGGTEGSLSAATTQEGRRRERERQREALGVQGPREAM